MDQVHKKVRRGKAIVATSCCIPLGQMKHDPDPLPSLAGPLPMRAQSIHQALQVREFALHRLHQQDHLAASHRRVKTKHRIAALNHKCHQSIHTLDFVCYGESSTLQAVNRLVRQYQLICL